MRTRPFRAPHYSASIAALLGGGSDTIMPGEISLAHNGIFFADEFCEAPKRALEALRAPMEDRKVVISRLKSKVEYPADFILVAASNPCPCGYYGEGDRCSCTPSKRIAYLSKLSGPILDRIDVQIFLRMVDPKRLVEWKKAEPSAAIAARVMAAREIQRKRFANESGTKASPIKDMPHAFAGFTNTDRYDKTSRPATISIITLEVIPRKRILVFFLFLGISRNGCRVFCAFSNT